jgi:hypothetical protein
MRFAAMLANGRAIGFCMQSANIGQTEFFSALLLTSTKIFQVASVVG